MSKARIISKFNISAANIINGTIGTDDIANGAITISKLDAETQANVIMGGSNQTNLEAVANVIPAGNNIYDLGSPTNRFKSLYVSGSTIYIGGVSMSASDQGSLKIEAPGVPTSNLATETTLSAVQGYLNSNVSVFPTGDYGSNVQVPTLDAFGTYLDNFYDCSDPRGSTVSIDLN